MPPPCSKLQTVKLPTLSFTFAWIALALLFGSAPVEGRDIDSALEALEAVAVSIGSVEKSIDEKSKELAKKTLTDTEKAQLEGEVKTLTQRLERLETDFTAISTGVESIESPKTETEEEFDVGEVLKELLKPMMREFKDATRQPREIEELRRQLSEAESRYMRLQQASKHIDELLKAEPDEAVKARLKKEQERWAVQLQQTESRTKTLNVQLEDNLNQKASLFETISQSVRQFFKSRGFSLLLMVVAFLVVFFSMRFLHSRFRKLSPWHRSAHRSFYVRSVDVLYQFATIFGAILAALIVLYVMGDWVLLVIAIIILLSITLAAKNGFPNYYQQVRILLNVGEVREGERIIFDGMPWKITALSFFSTLENKALQGGTLRIPVGMLIGKVSRPFDETEPWFPSEKGDWVRLSDETVGKVMVQSPENVQLLRLGGSRKTYVATDFLGMTPENLSGHFRLRSVFGVDYSHQAISTTEIPEKLYKSILVALYKVVDREQLQSLKVEVKQAGASSIDYEFIVDLRGDVAPKYEQIRRLLQRAAIDACNENDWIIPFTQVTVHTAEAPTAIEEAGASAAAIEQP